METRTAKKKGLISKITSCKNLDEVRWIYKELVREKNIRKEMKEFIWLIIYIPNQQQQQQQLSFT